MTSAVEIHPRTSWQHLFATSGYRVDIVLVTALAALAGLIRWPYLWLIPRFTDETLEIQASLAIVRDGTRPLTNYDSYYGALYNYLVALALALSGQSALAPRVVVLVAGVLTVALTYCLGRRLATLSFAGTFHDVVPAVPRWVGLIGAGLLAVNGPHVAINSHVAWSNCLTPLFTTAAFWSLLARGGIGLPLSHSVGVTRVAGGRGPALWGLPLAGLLLGLAFQTHPLVVALLPGIALGVLWGRWSLLRTPWPWLAAGCFLLGYANMLYFNATTGFESIRSAQRITSEYASDQQASAGYASGSLSMWLLLARILGGAADQRSGWPEYLLDPAVIITTGLSAAGLLVLARRHIWMPLFATLGFLLMLPAANPKFTTLITSRYLIPIVPLLFTCAGLGVVWLFQVGSRRWPGRRPAIQMIGALVVAVLLVLPLLGLGRYYERALSRTDTNERILRFTAEIQAARQEDEPVLIDEGIGSELPDTGITELRGFQYLLDVARVPHRAIRPSPGRLQDELDASSTVLAVLNARDASNAGSRVRVEPLDPRPPSESGRMSDFRLYRLSRGRA